MKSKLYYSTPILFILLLFPLVTLSQSWNFDDGTLQGWSASGATTNFSNNTGTSVDWTFNDGASTARIDNGSTNIVADNTPILFLRIKNPTSTNGIRLVYPIEGGGTNLDNTLTSSSNDFIEYYIPINNANFNGKTITSLSLIWRENTSTTITTGGTIEVDEIAFVSEIPEAVQNSFLFDVADDTEGWSTAQQGTDPVAGSPVVLNGIYSFNTNGSLNPRLAQTTFSIDADNGQWLHFNLKNNTTDYNEIRVRINTGGGATFVNYPIEVGDTEFQDYHFNLGTDLENWNGIIESADGLWLQFRNGSTSGTIEIEDIIFNNTAPVIDTDNDGISDKLDNCPNTPNPGQEDANNNGIGDACEVCDEPIGLTLGDISTTTADVSWTNTNVSSPEAWRISYVASSDPDGFASAAAVNFNTPDGTPSISLDPLNPNTEYIWRVRAICQFITDGSNIVSNWVEGPTFTTDTEIIDTDGDGVPDNEDNCPNNVNADQADTDGDGIGDVCDPQDDTDTDGDGVIDSEDNCPNNVNADQADTDGDGIGDVCDPQDDTDTDSDGVIDSEDNCPNNPNPGQEDANNNGIGDACEVCDEPIELILGNISTTTADVSWTNTNASSPEAWRISYVASSDPDGFASAAAVNFNTPDGTPSITLDPLNSNTEYIWRVRAICQFITGAPNVVSNWVEGPTFTTETEVIDTDGDGVPDNEDNCPSTSNSDQADADGDGIGDVCDQCPNSATGDSDGDGVCDDLDSCPGFDDSADSDNDGTPDGCDSEECDGLDNDGDGTIDEGFETTVYFLDNDGDGYGVDDANTNIVSCQDPGEGYSTDNGDCNDDDNTVFPGATDVPGDGIDQDCDGEDANDLNGCSIGYWKNNNDWCSSYSQNDLLLDVFELSTNETLALNYSGLTLEDGLKLKGGKLNRLFRHGVAALLNACSENINYSYSINEVIELVQNAVNSDKDGMEAITDNFEEANEQGCPTESKELIANVYPNPIGSNGFNIKIDNLETSVFSLKVYNLYGRLMAQKEVKVSSYNNRINWIIDTSKWDNGFYTLIGNNGSKEFKIKLIK